MTEKTEQTYWVKLSASGQIQIAEQVCREECLREGICVTIDQTKFIYTGGEEAGFVIGLINYPRFPTTPEKLWARAEHLASLVLERTCQHSILLMAPDKTKWITKREG